MKLLLAGEAIFSLRMAVKKSNYTGEGGGGEEGGSLALTCPFPKRPCVSTRVTTIS